MNGAGHVCGTFAANRHALDPEPSLSRTPSHTHAVPLLRAHAVWGVHGAQAALEQRLLLTSHGVGQCPARSSPPAVRFWWHPLAPAGLCDPRPTPCGVFVGEHPCCSSGDPLPLPFSANDETPHTPSSPNPEHHSRQCWRSCLCSRRPACKLGPTAQGWHRGLVQSGQHGVGGDRRGRRRVAHTSVARAPHPQPST